MICPLCGDTRSARSWLGATRYANQEFVYQECAACRSLFCDPMPDKRTLVLMYGPDYSALAGRRPGLQDPKDPAHVAAWLRRLPRGSFVDFGCGQGELLVAASSLGWRATGVELDPEVARQVAARTGATVVTSPEAIPEGLPADVVNLGDVVEHLTDPLRQVRDVLRILRRGGLLLAQGPLEANPDLFTLGLRAVRTVRPRTSSFPPYHVLLATSRGQRAFFSRLGLDEQEFQVSEVDWPAPSQLTREQLRQVRQVVMFVLRRASRLANALSGGRLGNRYFYAGRLN